jgi:nitroreductase
LDKEIEKKTLEELKKIINDCISDSALNIQLCVNEPEAFSSVKASYEKFKNVKNYIAFVGNKDDQLEEKIGYYGERIVLKAQQLGLNTCWVAMTYSKSKSIVKVKYREKLLMVIAVGYGEANGVAHKVKPIEKLCSVNGNMPGWFRKGVEAAQLAPTAMNQQKFFFELNGNKVKATAGKGFFTKVDLGIAKYHFEIGAAMFPGAGKDGWGWDD